MLKPLCTTQCMGSRAAARRLLSTPAQQLHCDKYLFTNRARLRNIARMPRLTKAFACAFNCHRNVLTSKASMVKHETHCKNNPVVMACPTCEHNGYERPEAAEYDMVHMCVTYPGCAGGYFCAEDRLPEGKTMVRGCAFWVKKQS